MRICHAAFAFIDQDPRILRSIAALRRAGHHVTSVGYGNGVTFQPMTPREKLRYAVRQMPAWVLPTAAVTRLYWTQRQPRELYRALVRVGPDVIHTHDCETLPAAARAARTVGARLVYDSHEFAQSMRAESWLWRLVFPAYARAIEGSEIRRTDATISVGPSMAQLLEQTYRLAKPVAVVRNVPDYVASPFRPVRPERVLLHYHGVINSGRGLANLIETLRLLPQRFHLRLTGPVRQPGYDQHLRAVAEQAGVTQRIEIHEAVAAKDLVAHAATADIGVSVAIDATRQKAAGLPNKVFEYVMAGLMVVGGPAADICALIERHGVGWAIDAPDAPELAARLNGLAPAEIDTFKRTSLEVARELHWEREAEALLRVYEQLDRPRDPAS